MVYFHRLLHLRLRKHDDWMLLNEISSLPASAANHSGWLFSDIGVAEHNLDHIGFARSICGRWSAKVISVGAYQKKPFVLLVAALSLEVCQHIRAFRIWLGLYCVATLLCSAFLLWLSRQGNGRYIRKTHRARAVAIVHDMSFFVSMFRNWLTISWFRASLGHVQSPDLPYGCSTW